MMAQIIVFLQPCPSDRPPIVGWSQTKPKIEEESQNENRKHHFQIRCSPAHCKCSGCSASSSSPVVGFAFIASSALLSSTGVIVESQPSTGGNQFGDSAPVADSPGHGNRCVRSTRRFPTPFPTSFDERCRQSVSRDRSHRRRCCRQPPPESLPRSTGLRQKAAWIHKQ